MLKYTLQNNKKHITKVLAVALTIAHVFVAVLVVSASQPKQVEGQEVAVANPQANRDLREYCGVEIFTNGLRAQAEFQSAVETVASNTQPTTEQLDFVFDEFRTFKAELFQLLEIAESKITTEGENAALEGFSLLSGCQQIVENLEADAQAFVSAFLKKTAGQKQNLALIQQYQALVTNTDLLLEELQHLNGNIVEFTESVPCFAESCVFR